MANYIMVEVAVKVNGDIEDVSKIMENTIVDVTGDKVEDFHIENYYSFEC